MLENQQDLTNIVGDEGTNFKRVYLEGRLGGAKVTAGRFNQTVVEGEVYGTRMDGIDIKYGDKVRLGAYYSKPTDSASLTYDTKKDDKWTTKDSWKYDRMWGVNAAADLGKYFTLGVSYDEFRDFNEYTADGLSVQDLDDIEKAKVFSAGLKYKVKDFTLGATYLHSNGGVLRTSNDYKEGTKSGGFVFANYKGAKADKVGSWGIGVRYYHMPAGLVANNWDTSTALGKAEIYANDAKTARYARAKPLLWEDYKGIYAKANVTVAKNMIAGIQYWNLKGRETNVKNKTLWTDFVVTF